MINLTTARLIWSLYASDCCTGSQAWAGPQGAASCLALGGTGASASYWPCPPFPPPYPATLRFFPSAPSTPHPCLGRPPTVQQCAGS